MSYNKKKAVTEIIQINKLFESSKNDKYKIINVIIIGLFENDFNIYKKKVLNIIINTILYKKNINDDEKNIILYIINIIEGKNRSVNVVYYDILINIIDTIYLRRSIGGKKQDIIDSIIAKFNELNNYINFAKVGSISAQVVQGQEPVVPIPVVPIQKGQEIPFENYSKIKVYVYKVFHDNEENHKNYIEEYSFSKGIKKTESANSTYIKSNQNNIKQGNGLVKYTIDNSKIYSKDIIESRSSNNNANICQCRWV